jgi:flagellar biosynthesis chaperone FliJ
MNERTRRAIATLVRLREVEERRALEDVARDRDLVENARARVSELEDRGEESRRRIEQHSIRLRAYLATLDRCAENRRQALEERERDLLVSRRRFGDARSRRRVFEALRDRPDTDHTSTVDGE